MYRGRQNRILGRLVGCAVVTQDDRPILAASALFAKFSRNR
jgi:hypothetical protein